MLGKQLGVDLGTANVLVYVKGRGIVINEPSIVAVARQNNTIVAVGSEAAEMEGRTPEAIQVIRPMRHGVIADYLTTEAMLRYLIAKAVGRLSFVKPEVVICAPVGATGVERRAVQEACEAAGARRPVHVIPEPLAAALGARIPIDSPQGHMVVDIGGGRTEAAIISLYGIVVSESVRVAGDRLDEAIANHIKRRHNLIIGERTAEEVKIALGSALPLEEELTMEVRGRDQITGLPRTITVTASEVCQALQEPLQAIVGAIRSVFERTPPELVSDIIDHGIVLVGGGAMLRNLDRLITQVVGIPCYVAENPLTCVAMGAGVALEYLDLIKRAMPPEEEWAVAF
ncbi:MAG TPA: rod shape-determining protein [Dehalococcoidia bacterium]|nr:rod shape-determining protein [Dehalococcoidia bacterium]